MLVVVFCAAAIAMFEVSSFQWPGMDDFIWPTALGLLVISIAALMVPVVPAGRRAITLSPHKISFAVSYAILACYTFTGVVILVFLPFKAASGI